MSTEFKEGDRVEWKTSQGKTVGEVETKLTEPIEIKGHHVAASEENPEYLVKSEKTGKEAAHKPDALKKVKKK
jgi:Hypervirulence associated proteins TUDOR domain